MYLRFIRKVMLILPLINRKSNFDTSLLELLAFSNEKESGSVGFVDSMNSNIDEFRQTQEEFRKRN